MTKTIFKKPILAAIIAIAFVAGTTTGTVTYAAPGDQGKPFEVLQQAIEDLQTQIDDISQGVQVDQDGNTVLSNDLQVTGDTFLGDTTIASDLIVGPTNIDSVTGDVEVGGAFTCTGCIGADALAAGVVTIGKIYVTSNANNPSFGAGEAGQLSCSAFDADPAKSNDIILDAGWVFGTGDFDMKRFYVEPLDRLNIHMVSNSGSTTIGWSLTCLEVLP